MPAPNYLKEFDPPTTFQKEIIIGSLLGDASLSGSKKKSQNLKFLKSQSKFDNNKINKRDYLQWHFNKLLPYSANLLESTINLEIINTGRNPICIRNTEQEKYSYTFYTHCHPYFTELSKKWYLRDVDGNYILNSNNRKIKIVPPDLQLTPLTVCIWFMDDGTLDAKHGNALFCTHGFTVSECEYLVEKLKKDVNINGEVRLKYKRYPVIFVGVKSYFDLIEMIKPYVEWNCFQYKLDDSYCKKHQEGENHSMSKLKNEEVKEIFKLRSEGKQSKEIAKQFNVSRPAISLILNNKRFGHLQLKAICKKGSKRLTIDQINNIIELSKNGLTQQKISQQMNICQSRVSRVLSKRTYKGETWPISI